HDDQHGTAIVVLAALTNALKVVGKKLGKIKIVISGAGAAGTAVAKLLIAAGAKDILMLDSGGIIAKTRRGLSAEKKSLAKITNSGNIQGELQTALADSDVFIGVSKPGILKPEMVKLMAKKPIVFALSNPVPEIMPELAKKAGAFVVATGRSDFANQINNVLVFPGFFRGLLDAGIKKITNDMKLKAAFALAGLIKNPNKDKILPPVFDKRVVYAIADAVKKAGAR
ncbi:MAG: NAD-dependent malic enzyme, partial [Candidatus Doudnabacteria bacterium]|nr:NAD-dependent malic enzyme [Candidatus Doudnabacteria bacterium]